MADPGLCDNLNDESVFVSFTPHLAGRCAFSHVSVQPLDFIRLSQIFGRGHSTGAAEKFCGHGKPMTTRSMTHNSDPLADSEIGEALYLEALYTWSVDQLTFPGLMLWYVARGFSTIIGKPNLVRQAWIVALVTGDI